jgi:NAD(P)-dependent dehydrogenase (short-subunit alcohol dehydrogenase family)
MTDGARRVLVVGGGKGVGAALVRNLAAAGYNIDFTYRSSQAQAEALIGELLKQHPNRVIRSFPLDLADKVAVEAFCSTIEDTAYYAYVHNAGQPYDMLAAMIDQDKAESAMQVNFWSMVRIVKSIVRLMIRAKTGRIVGIGSVAALEGNTGNAAYAASKGAMLSYLRTVAIETAKRGITVNYVAPGFIDTDMMAPYAGYREKMEKQVPVGRFAKPEDIAALVRFLVSQEAGYMTGAVLPIDGGLTANIAIQR